MIMGFILGAAFIIFLIVYVFLKVLF